MTIPTGLFLLDLLTIMDACAAHTIRGRIRVHKYAALLRDIGLGRLPQVHFEYHHYGPYSRDWSDILQDAVARGLITEMAEPRGPGEIRYNYTLTDQGRDFTRSNGDLIDRRISAAMPILDPAQRQALELASTIAFVEREEGKPYPEARARALELKDHCRPFLAEAEDLLSRLRALHPTPA